MLASHLPGADILDIESFLILQGIPKLLESQSVKDLIIWREIFPKSCDRGLNATDPTEETKIYETPAGRWYLAVIARNQMLMAVVLEHRDLSVKPTEYIGPSPFYIEEIQDTLEHLKEGGIEVLARTWVTHNKRPQCAIDGNSDFNANPTINSKKTELISILKRRNTSTDNLRDSTRQPPQSHAGSSVSEDSNAKFEEEDDESDSDWDGFPDSQKGSSGFDMSEMTETLLKEVSDIIPTR